MTDQQQATQPSRSARRAIGAFKFLWVLFVIAIYAGLAFLGILGAAVNRGDAEGELMFQVFGLLALVYPIAFVWASRHGYALVAGVIGLVIPPLFIGIQHHDDFARAWERDLVRRSMAVDARLELIRDEPIYDDRGAIEGLRLTFAYRLPEIATESSLTVEPDDDDLCVYRYPSKGGGSADLAYSVFDVSAVKVHERQTGATIDANITSNRFPLPGTPKTDYEADIELRPIGCDVESQSRLQEATSHEKDEPLLETGVPDQHMSVHFRMEPTTSTGSDDRTVLINTAGKYNLGKMLDAVGCKPVFYCRPFGSRSWRSDC